MTEKNHLLIELQNEEIPARFLANASKEIGKKILELLQERQENIRLFKAFYTPRRFAWLFELSSNIMPAKNIEKRGPPVSIKEEIKNKFISSAKKDGFEKIEEKSDGKNIYLYAVKILAEIEVNKYLQQNLKKTITSYRWAKSMRFNPADFRWARPLRGAMIVYNKSYAQGLSNKGDIKLNAFTYPHRSISDLEKNNQITISSALNYAKEMLDNKVIVDYNDRRERILSVSKQKWRENILKNPALLDEVTNLCEYPEPYILKINAEWQKLPKELIFDVLAKHQRYIPLVADDNSFENYLVVVDHAKATQEMALGHEKVVAARLNDAKYFLDLDLKQGIDKISEEAKSRTYFRAYTFEERQNRISKIAATQTFIDSKSWQDLTHYVFADLASETVNEMPDLRGTIGSYLYSQKKDFSKDVAEGLKYIYGSKPLSSSANNIAFFIAERLERVSLLWNEGIKPSGSGDFYAIRRASLEIIRAINDKNNKFQINEKLIQELQISKEFEAFMEERAKSYLIEKNFDTRLIDAVLAVKGNLFELHTILNHIQNANDFLETSKGKTLKEVWKRVVNMLKNQKIIASFNPSLLATESEKKLNTAIDNFTPEKLNVKSSLEKLVELAPVLENFMNDPSSRVLDCLDSNISANRLALLHKIKGKTLSIMDFSILVGNVN